MLLIVLVALLSVFLFGFMGFHLVELIYAKLFGKPLLIYTHLKLKRLSLSQENLLKSNFSFYRNLSNRKKKIFGHRVLSFIADKQFIRRDGEVVNEEMKFLIAGTAAMLTFGMRKYLISSVKRIIIYPDQYPSLINDADHIGEYNKALNTIVFSWKHFLEGLEKESDNLNLGVHEFAHAMSFGSLNLSDISSVLFLDGLEEIDDLLIDKKYMSRLVETEYFREYALTNKYEFFAVALEHFVETPKEFKKLFPKLFDILKKMLNYELVLK